MHFKFEPAEQFQELFENAVSDRLRTSHVAVELSGGLDSTSIAAVAKDGTCSLTGYTISCKGMLPEDEEGFYASAVASHLNIPIVHQLSEDYPLFWRFDDPQLHTSEPSANPEAAIHQDKLDCIVGSGGRVLLSGQGGDAMFSYSSTHYADLFMAGCITRLCSDLFRHLRATGSLAGLGLRSALMRSAGDAPWQPAFPDWVDADFARQTLLRDRWHSGWATIRGAVSIQQQLSAPWVSSTFESYEALKMPLIARHPFFDSRLAEFMVGLPTYLKVGKRLMRDAMRGKLPESVRTRSKAGLAGDHIRIKFAEGRSEKFPQSILGRAGNSYIDPVSYRAAFQRYAEGEGIESTWQSFLMITPIAFDICLRDHFDCGSP